jgi:membrane peptidoglycan carboxypeptidase
VPASARFRAGEHTADRVEQGRYRGTAAASAKAANWTRPVASKTGTTEQYESAGFFGVVPQAAGAVIVFDNSSSPKPLCDPWATAPPVACDSGNIYGGKAPARTWFRAMNTYLAGRPALPLRPTDPRYTRGGRPATIPDVIGRTVADAQSVLAQGGWPSRIQQVDNRAREGTVIGQFPEGTAMSGETVTLDISSGQVRPPPPPPGENPVARPLDH